MNNCECVLLIDAGGTYVKTAIAKAGKILQGNIYPTKDFEIETIKKICEANKGCRISDIVIACAGPVNNGRCQLVNANLMLDEKMIFSMTGIAAKLINDLEAAAYFFKKTKKSSLIIGIGTGLGVSIIDGRGNVTPTEDGHVLIERELFFSMDCLRSTNIPQYEFILGGKKNILQKIISRQGGEIKLQNPPDRFTEAYMAVFESFIQKLLSMHRNINFKNVVLIGGVAKANRKFLDNYSAVFKKKTKLGLEIIDDEYVGVKGALCFHDENSHLRKTEKLMNIKMQTV